MKRITKIKENASLDLGKKLRVAAYCRVSTGSDEQLVSLEAQKNHYETYIKSNPEWEFAGLYFDEGGAGELNILISKISIYRNKQKSSNNTLNIFDILKQKAYSVFISTLGE